MNQEKPTTGKVEVQFTTEFSLPELLEQQLQQQPDKVALIEGDCYRSYAQSIHRIYQMANGLIALGVEPGDRVAMLSPNSMAYSELFAATLLAGACAVPLQSMITEQSLNLMLQDSGARVLVVAEVYASMAAPFLAAQSQLLPGGLMGFDFSTDQFCALETWLVDIPDSAPGLPIDPDAEFNIIYSSGTTGVPKGIVHSHRTRQGLAVGLMRMGISKDSITLITTPLYSNTTITTWWPSLCAGATMVIEKKFDAERTLALIGQHKVTHAMFVPVQYDRMVRAASFRSSDLSSMQCKYCTSAPLRAALKADIIDYFDGELIEFYGLTEGGVGTCFVGSVARKLDKLASVGSALPGATLKILDEQNRELPVGQVGEIVGRSGSMSNGYHNREEANNDMHWYDSEGQLYYKSGDVGYLDDDGWLYLSDRKKDMIISGGFNIYATDLELVLLENPGVHEVAVVSLASRDWGETPLAIVVPEGDAELDQESLRSWANAKLGKSQRISQLVFTDELPKSSIGKVLKKELRQEYAALADSDSHPISSAIPSGATTLQK